MSLWCATCHFISDSNRNRVNDNFFCHLFSIFIHDAKVWHAESILFIRNFSFMRDLKFPPTTDGYWHYCWNPQIQWVTHLMAHASLSQNVHKAGYCPTTHSFVLHRLYSDCNPTFFRGILTKSGFLNLDISILGQIILFCGELPCVLYVEQHTPAWIPKVLQILPNIPWRQIIPSWELLGIAEYKVLCLGLITAI